ASIKKSGRPDPDRALAKGRGADGHYAVSIVGPRLRHTLVRYAFATAMTGFVTATSVALRPVIQPRHDAPFLLAVLIVAWVVGFGPALLTSALSILSMNYFFIPPLHSLRLFSAH